MTQTPLPPPPASMTPAPPMTQDRSIPPSWRPFARRFGESWAALLGASSRSAEIDRLPAKAVAALARNWLLNARPAQLPPDDDLWRTWLFLGGRGSGKTRAGAEWLTAQARPGARLALIGHGDQDGGPVHHHLAHLSLIHI